MISRRQVTTYLSHSAFRAYLKDTGTAHVETGSLAFSASQNTIQQLHILILSLQKVLRTW